MLKNLFRKKEYDSKSGFFKVEGKELIPINDLENGSINDCITKIGYPINHIHTVHTFDSDKISVLAFKTLTKQLEFVLVDNDSKITFSDVDHVLKKVNWDHEYSDLNVEDIIQLGIDYENFDLKFLNSILSLTKEHNSLYKSEKFGLYLQFEKEILIAFTSSEWENSSTKWLRDLNSQMVERMIHEAKLFQKNEIEAMEEVNNQTKAFMNVPKAVENEFLPLHRTDYGNINFYNLVIAHYTQDCMEDEFIFMNKGRFKKLGERCFEVGRFKYEFDHEKKLERVYSR